MPIRVQCTGCKTALAVKDHLAGKRVKCPKCQTPVSVPAAAVTGLMPVNKPPVAKKPTVPVAKPADMESLAADAFRDQPPAAAPETNGTNGHAPKPPIKFHCTYCDFEIETDADSAGKMTPCPECSRIVKVPLPKVEKPKDWRTIEKKGPSMAMANVPEKIENAWGTETKTKVSQTALLEAGVIAKAKPASIGWAGWVARGVKVFLVVAIGGSVGYGLVRLRETNVAKAEMEHGKKMCDPKWPAVVQARYYAALGQRTLQGDKSADSARELFITAWQKVDAGGSSDARDKIDRDFFLIDLAKAQVSLGGDEMQIRGKDRYDWNQEVFGEIERTIQKIESPEAKVMAVRELTAEFAERKKSELSVSLANSVAAATPPAKSQRIALVLADGTKSANLPSIKDATKDVVVRCGYAEGYARQDGKLDEAMKVAQSTGDSTHKFQALIAIGSSLALDKTKDRTAEIRDACDKATSLLEKDAKANFSAWTLLQHVRLMARSDAELAKTLAHKLPPAFKRRAHLEIVLAAIDKIPPPANGPQLIQELDKEGPSRALAWFALAQAKSRANLHFEFAPEDVDDETYRPFVKIVQSLPMTTAK